MKTVIATDIHIHNHNSQIQLAKQIYHIIKRYHDNLGEIILYCREDNSPTKEELFPIDDIVSKCITFRSLFGTVYGEEKKKLEEAVKESDLVIGRFHAFSACEAATLARKHNKPFLAEVMGDAWDGYWNHGVNGKLIAPWMFFRTKKAIHKANYGLYVTEHFLQDKYPCKGKTINASNVELSGTTEEVLQKRIEKINKMRRTDIQLLTAANVDVRAKGHEYVIKSLPILAKNGINVTYYIAGGGDKSYLEGIAIQKKVRDRVVFLGRLSAEEVKKSMDECDIYIQPSLQEGLPRSVIEAMSRGCPCLGARTAGIPELIQPECVFKRGSEKAIAETLSYVLKLDLEKIAKHNYFHSQEYLAEILNERRKRLFEKIKDDIGV